MASRKEQKETLRQERLEREQAEQRAAARKRMVGIVVAAILVLGIAGALIAVVVSGGDDDGGSGGGGGHGGGAESASVEYPDGGEIPDQKTADLKAAMAAAGCKDETVEAAGAGDHTSDPDEHIKYQSEPPALGRHYQEWPEDDIFEDAPKTSHVVHTLEHGRVLIWLNPAELSEDDLAQFKALYEEDPYHVIMLPRAELKEPFAVSAWVGQDKGHVLRCQALNEDSWDAIRAFKEQYRDKAPEFVP